MSPSKNINWHDAQGGSAFAVRVFPKAAHNALTGVMDDGRMKVRLIEPTVEGQANQILVAFLSEILEIPQSRIEIVAGETKRDKLVVFLGVASETLQEKIQKATKSARN